MASMNCWIREEDIGKMCSFLISNDGERISGQAPPVDGNAKEWTNKKSLIYELWSLHRKKFNSDGHAWLADMVTNPSSHWLEIIPKKKKKGSKNNIWRNKNF
ncbi:MAG: hypothetical protein Ct9H300mP5_1090 [Candidatus Pelagibacterales bacterium]|nr:MAG: hypothetical protein Ct9H300mP5_1090 [Pelagibacterales bacterium]